MVDTTKEKYMGALPDPVSLKGTQKIMEQMNNSICKIEKDQATGTGFISIIPFPDKFNQLPVLFTCNHVLNNNELKIGRIIKLIFNQKEISIKLSESRKIYTSDENEYDNYYY